MFIAMKQLAPSVTTAVLLADEHLVLVGDRHIAHALLEVGDALAGAFGRR